jgi:hypothetical protein
MATGIATTLWSWEDIIKRMDAMARRRQLHEAITDHANQRSRKSATGSKPCRQIPISAATEQKLITKNPECW